MEQVRFFLGVVGSDCNCTLCVEAGGRTVFLVSGLCLFNHRTSMWSTL